MAKAKRQIRRARVDGRVTLPVLQCTNPKCHHRWIPRVGSPIECPKCKGRHWRKVGSVSPSGV